MIGTGNWRYVIAFSLPSTLMHSLRGIRPRLSLTRSSVVPPLPLNRFALPAHPKLSFFNSRSASTMDDNVKQHYLADSPPTVVRLEIKSHFDSLQDQTLRKYAHYMSRYAITAAPPHSRSMTLT